MNTKQAKDFLVEQTSEQAVLEGVPLSDVEKKMMYFTESDPSSCEDPIELNDEFEEQYETSAYEAKISRLLHRARRRLKEENPRQLRNWDQAMRTLRKGDHYILVMADQSSESGLDWWMPVFWGIGISVLLFIVMVVEINLDPRGLIPNWLFSWLPDAQHRKGALTLAVAGCFGLWVIVYLARVGELGDVAKDLLREFLSPFRFLLPKRPPRK